MMKLLSAISLSQYALKPEDIQTTRLQSLLLFRSESARLSFHILVPKLMMNDGSSKCHHLLIFLVTFTWMMRSDWECSTVQLQFLRVTGGYMQMCNRTFAANFWEERVRKNCVFSSASHKRGKFWISQSFDQRANCSAYTRTYYHHLFFQFHQWLLNKCAILKIEICQILNVPCICTKKQKAFLAIFRPLIGVILPPRIHHIPPGHVRHCQDIWERF